MPTKIPHPNTDIDVYSPAFAADPHGHYEKLRALGPIVWMNSLGAWAVTRYEDVLAILKNDDAFLCSGGAGIVNYHKVKPWRPPSVLMEADAPLHKRMRGVIERILSRDKMKSLEVLFKKDADEMVNALSLKGTFDAMSDFAYHFPLATLPDIVGITPEGRENLVMYGAMVAAGFRGNKDAIAAAMVHADAVLPWIDQCCRREALADGSLGAQIYEYVDTGEITEEEAGMLVRSFLSAGVGTTRNAVAHAIWCILDNPSQWQLLRKEPTLAEAAFEETLRYGLVDQNCYRTAAHDLEYAGVSLKQYDKILVSLGAANCDPSRWPDPYRFDLTRDLKGHLGYGYGTHECVATMLARFEGVAVLSAFARIIDTIKSVEPVERRIQSGSRAIVRMPVAVTIRSSGNGLS
ncbi:MAG: cytochrome P450 [Arenicellales bacterium]|nr:cytochrome P450 [Arenicellales bacterium]